MLKVEVDIGLRPAIITPITKLNVLYFWIFQKILLFVMEELGIVKIPATLHPKEDIVGVIVQDVEVGLKRSTTLPCKMLEKVLMVLVEVDPALLPPIVQVIVVDHKIF